MIVPPSFLFQYQLSVPRIDGLQIKKKRAMELPETCRIFVPAKLNEGAPGLEVRLAWNPEGLALELAVHGKKLEPSGRRSDLKHSDFILVMFDTRHTASVHRATEFCTVLQILPADEDADDQPTVQFTDPGQHRTVRRDRDAKRIIVSAKTINDGYQTGLWVPAQQLPGFSETPEIGHMGFYLVVEDTELGQLPLSIGDDFPVAHDPSTWLQLNF